MLLPLPSLGRHKQNKKLQGMLNEIMTVGADVFMKNEEVRRGYTLVNPGDFKWLPKEEWVCPIISRDGNLIRLVGLIAVKPKDGAFTRLVNGIIQDGFIPVVCTPTVEMREILGRWNWKQQLHYVAGVGREEQWQPRQWFIDNRRALMFASAANE